MSSYIIGIGTAVPEHSIRQDDAAELSKSLCCKTPSQERLLPALYRRAGVAKRHSVILHASDGPRDQRQAFFLPSENGNPTNAYGPTTGERMQLYEQEAGRLAQRAAHQALADADLDPKRITHLVTVSCSGFHAPGVDVSLIKQLDLARSVSRTHVGFMGCHGALNGLRVARSFVESDPRNRVLLCAVELCSLHHHYCWDPEKIVANALFADGAAALVCASEAPQTENSWRNVGAGSVIIDDSEDVMSWRIGDHGFEMTLSPQVPSLIHKHVRPWMEGWLESYGLQIEDIDQWAVHPGGRKILGAFGEAVGLDRSRWADSERILSEFGNMSSPTVLFILDHFRKQQRRGHCVALGFGPGLAIEASLLQSSP